MVDLHGEAPHLKKVALGRALYEQLRGTTLWNRRLRGMISGEGQYVLENEVSADVPS